MVLDNELQRTLILELLNEATVLGKSIDLIYQFKQDVLRATIKVQNKDDKSQET